MHKPFFWEPHLEVTQQAVWLGEGSFILPTHGDSEGFIPLTQEQSCAFPAELCMAFMVPTAGSRSRMQSTILAKHKSVSQMNFTFLPRHREWG